MSESVSKLPINSNACRPTVIEIPCNSSYRGRSESEGGSSCVMAAAAVRWVWLFTHVTVVAAAAANAVNLTTSHLVSDDGDDSRVEWGFYCTLAIDK